RNSVFGPRPRVTRWPGSKMPMGMCFHSVSINDSPGSRPGGSGMPPRRIAGGIMKKALILGTLLGGLAAFVWSSISWEVVGWHEKTMVSFQNEDEVSAVIASHAATDGIYLL